MMHFRVLNYGWNNNKIFKMLENVKKMFKECLKNGEI